jgi:alkanesulfonate monooxygenase SsuD/methylene tetrahydromethanopterin reductase-like flavin-dependent oxidoreductase (luciferase family)
MQRVPEHGMPHELTRLVEAKTQAYDYYEGHLDSSAEHTGWLTPELIDDFAITGTADRCLQRIRELADCGVDEISTAYLNGKAEQLRRVGREILPAVAAIAA